MTTKYWVSADGQASIGEWPDDIPDREIMATLLEQAGSDGQRETIRAGTIERDAEDDRCPHRPGSGGCVSENGQGWGPCRYCGLDLAR